MSDYGIGDCNEVERKGMRACEPLFDWYANGRNWSAVPGEIQRKEADSMFILEGDITFRHADKRETCECKFEVDYTGNFFLEWRSNAVAPDRQNNVKTRLGWFERLNTDLLFAHFADGNQAFIVPVRPLREWLLETPYQNPYGDYGLPVLYSEFKLREQRKSTQQNRTVGFIVPIRKVMESVPEARAYRIVDGKIVEHESFKNVRFQRELFGITG